MSKEHFPGISDKKLEAMMQELIELYRISHEDFTKQQLASAVAQAIKAGDFTKHILQWSNKQQVIYIPFTRERELSSKADAWKEVAEKALHAAYALYSFWNEGVGSDFVANDAYEEAIKSYEELGGDQQFIFDKQTIIPRTNND